MPAAVYDLNILRVRQLDRLASMTQMLLTNAITESLELCRNFTEALTPLATTKLPAADDN